MLSPVWALVELFAHKFEFKADICPTPKCWAGFGLRQVAVEKTLQPKD
jgi:hypothetical protein